MRIDIGLGPTAPTISGTRITVDANVDTSADGKNDSSVQVKPHEAKVTASVLNVREQAASLPANHPMII